MKDGIKQIVGKTISAVVIANNVRRPHHQIFLVFDDETSYEIYGDSFTCAGGIDKKGIDRVLRYAKVAMGAVVSHVYLGAGPSNVENNSDFSQPHAGIYLH
jgi:hypothetical protein